MSIQVESIVIIVVKASFAGLLLTTIPAPTCSFILEQFLLTLDTLERFVDSSTGSSNS